MRTFTLRINGADTSVVCQIIGTVTTCTSATATVSVPAASLLLLKQASTSGMDAAVGFIGMECR